MLDFSQTIEFDFGVLEFSPLAEWPLIKPDSVNRGLYLERNSPNRLALLFVIEKCARIAGLEVAYFKIPLSLSLSLTLHFLEKIHFPPIMFSWNIRIDRRMQLNAQSAV